ncbi:hypothetical protein [Natrinema salaciae]|uniref:Uncharacterized protein n=1 Tax=Natrinema salaciae TaxID=1186196 RepID=A0A1H9F5N4_9EURY|nr:hypothetical protein [Natrinema salaciae]SEQ33232.1 hypothetical protein SAMN04489841_1476 [Natrinema salaciae]
MSWQPIDVAASAVLAFVAGVALWPPRHVYWVRVSSVLGESLTLGAVGVLAVIVGVVAVALLELRLSAFVGGVLLAYAVGMALIAVVLEPISPVHLVLYGGLIACFVLGAVITTRRRDAGNSAADSSRRTAE